MKRKIKIITEPSVPVEMGFNTAIPFETAVYDDGRLIITCFEEFRALAEDFADKFNGSPLSADALTYVDSLLSEPMRQFGYEPDAKQNRRWMHVYMIDSADKVNREVIRPDSLLLTPDMVYENRTTFDMDMRFSEELICCGTIINGRLVSVAGENPCMDEIITEIGVETIPGFRRMGLAASNTALLALTLVNEGMKVNYVCNSRNIGSRRVAETAGFAHTGKLFEYVCYAAG